MGDEEEESTSRLYTSDCKCTSSPSLHLHSPGYNNPTDVYASFDSAGELVNIYWIDNDLYLENDELECYAMPQHQLMAEDIGLSGNQLDITQSDHGGCMLSIVGGNRFGVLQRDERANGVQF